MLQLTILFVEHVRRQLDSIQFLSRRLASLTNVRQMIDLHDSEVKPREEANRHTDDDGERRRVDYLEHRRGKLRER